MDAGEPDLLRVLSGLRRDPVLPKEPPSLVDCNRVSHDIDVRQPRSEWVTRRIPDPPDRGHCIPDAKKVNGEVCVITPWDVTRERLPERIQHVPVLVG